MELSILEGIYYIAGIIVSLGVFRGFFNLFKISNKYEILLISNYQKKILKYFYFIKYFILGYFIYGYFYFSYCVLYDIICIIIYWLMFFNLIYFFDDISIYISKDKIFLLLYKKIMQKFGNRKNIFVGVMSICLALFFYFVEKKVGAKFYTIAQILCVCILYCFISDHHLQIRNKYPNFSYKLLIIYLSPLLIKLLYVLTYTPKNNVIVLSITEDNVISALSNIAYSGNLIYIIGTILILTLCFSKCVIDIDFGYTLYIVLKNKSWQISYITNDNYAICTYGNFTIMIKVEVIKNNYVCVHEIGHYIFYEKEKFKQIIE